MKRKSGFRRFIIRMKSMRIGHLWESFWKKLGKPFEFCWKAGAVLIGLFLAVELVGRIVHRCKYELGLIHLHLWDEMLSDKIEIRHFSDNTVATFDVITDERLSPRFKWISCAPERDSITVFCDKEGKRGYLNVNTGRVLIKGQYKHAWHFSEGLAAVVSDNGKVGFINYDNEMVIPPVYDYMQDYDYLFKYGKCIVVDTGERRYGAIDTLGNLVLPMEYSRIFKADCEETWYLRKNGKCGLADADMTVIFEPIYNNISVIASKNCAYLILDGVKQLVTYDGNVLQPFVIEDTWPLRYVVATNPEDDEYAVHPYLVEFSIDYRCHGVMDSRTGNVVIPAIYSNIELISKDLIMAEVDDYSGNNIVFTTDGRQVSYNLR